jgi:uncharacterized protein YgbK (DUF1537 family)
MDMQLAFYGDDFTGSTDALEALTLSGLKCALFLDVPDASLLQRLGPLDAIGVAGASRSMSPQEMDQELAPVLARLAQLPVPIVHYKVCSTFDSSETVGSIGHAMDLARRYFAPTAIPVVAATPALARYCAFSHLFARSATDGQIHRIDRHPIMSKHPVTPMSEANLVLHLGRQTSMPIDGFTLPMFELEDDAKGAQWLRRCSESAAGAVLIDGVTPDHMTQTGRLLQLLADQSRHSGRPGKPIFCVGGSGVEYALTQWWHAQQPSASSAVTLNPCQAVTQVLAVSGSASALSARQIEYALGQGFVDLAADPVALADGSGMANLIQKTLQSLQAGHSVMLHTARGLQDPRMQAHPQPADHAWQRRMGQGLAQVVEGIVRQHRLPRLLLSGGDTSSWITQRLKPDALQMVAQLDRGAPLCRFISSEPHLHDLEVSLKGGQMGQTDFFVRALNGQ